MKILGISFGIILLLTFLFIQLKKNEPDKEIRERANKLIGSKIALDNLKPLSEKFCFPDSFNFKVIVFGNADCSLCEHLIKLLNNIEEEDNVRKNLVVIFPSFQEHIVMGKYNNINFPIFFMPANEVTKKIKYVPTFLLLNQDKIIVDVVQADIIVKEDLDLMIADFSKKIKISD